MTEQVNAGCGQGWLFTSCPHQEDLQDCILCVCAHGHARDCGETPIAMRMKERYELQLRIQMRASARKEKTDD